MSDTADMRTAKDWLALGDKLAVELAKVLKKGEKWKHNIFIGSGSLPDFACKKCDWSCSLGAMACFVGDGIASKESGQYVLHQIENSQKRLITTSGGHQFKPECSVPDSIVLGDLGGALQRFRTFSRNELFDAMLDMARPHQPNGEYSGMPVDQMLEIAERYCLREATARELWIICAMALQGGQK